MKYSIETTDNGCVETLEFSDGEKYSKRWERTESGCKELDKDLDNQMESAGICEEVLDKVDELFNTFMQLGFIELSEMAE